MRKSIKINEFNSIVIKVATFLLFFVTEIFTAVENKKKMESCKGNPKNSSCLNCPVQHDRNSINWTKYFGSDHLKFKRMKKFKCKSKRIRLLALPKHYRPKYSRLNPDERVKKTIEISRDEQLSTRIRMLAVPKVRRLVASFEEYKKFVSEEKLNNIQQLVGHSMMTMYSRLANIHLAENRQCRKKWTKHDWQRHCEWLKKRACPKKPFCLKKKKCPEKILPLSELEYSIFRLSQPRHAREKYRPDYGYHSVIKDACKEYKPTERIIELATPKKPVDPIKRKRTIDVEEEPVIFYANPNALTYNASKYYCSVLVGFH